MAEAALVAPAPAALDDGEAPPLVDPEAAGVRLSVYAAVVAHLGEGITLGQSLDHVALTPDEWAAAEGAWAKRLAASGAGDGALLDAFDRHRMAAEAEVARPLPPLDEELGAWLAFNRAFTASEDPLGFLEQHGVADGDVFRLLGLWQERGSADPKVRDEMLRLLGEPAGPVPEVHARPPALRAETRRPRRRPEEPASAPVTLVSPPTLVGPPSGLGEADLPTVAPTPCPPPILPPRDERKWDETPLSPLPVMPELRLPALVPGATPVSSPAPFTSSAAPEAPLLSLTAYAAFCNELSAAPEQAGKVHERYGLDEARASREHWAWRVRLDASPAEKAEFDEVRRLVQQARTSAAARALGGATEGAGQAAARTPAARPGAPPLDRTVTAMSPFARPLLPFQHGPGGDARPASSTPATSPPAPGAGSPSPAPRGLPVAQVAPGSRPKEDLGGTVAPTALRFAPSLPFASPRIEPRKEDLNATVAPASARFAPPLPFAGTAGAGPAAPPAHPAPQASPPTLGPGAQQARPPTLGAGTQQARPPTLGAGAQQARPAVPPAQPAGGPPPAREPRLAVHAYALMCAEIAANPAAAVATVARYELSLDGKRAEDAAWQARFAADPGLRLVWTRLVEQARSKLPGGG